MNPNLTLSSEGWEVNEQASYENIVFELGTLNNFDPNLKCQKIVKFGEKSFDGYNISGNACSIYYKKLSVSLKRRLRKAVPEIVVNYHGDRIDGFYEITLKAKFEKRTNHEVFYRRITPADLRIENLSVTFE